MSRVRVDSLCAASARVYLWLPFDLSKRRRSKKKDFFLGKSSMYLSRNPAPHLPSSTSVRSHSQSSCSSTLLGGKKSSQIFLSLRSVIIWNLPSSLFRATRPWRRRSRKAFVHTYNAELQQPRFSTGRETGEACMRYSKFEKRVLEAI